MVFSPPPPPPNLDSFEGFTTLDAKIKAPLKVLNQQLFHSTYFGIAPDHRTVVPGHSPIPRVNDLDGARTFLKKFSLLHIFPQRRDHIKTEFLRLYL